MKTKFKIKDDNVYIFDWIMKLKKNYKMIKKTIN